MTPEQHRRAIELHNQILDLVQGTRIREVQAMAEAKWDKHHRGAAQDDWNEFNRAHEALFHILHDTRATQSVVAAEGALNASTENPKE